MLSRTEGDLYDDIAEHLTMEYGVREKAPRNAWLGQDLGLDECDLFEIVVWMEMLLGPIPDDAVETFHTVGDLVNYCHRRMG